MSPLIRNKIDIDCSAMDAGRAKIKGHHKAIRTAYEAAERLAMEIEGRGWSKEPEALKFLDRQVAVCRTTEGHQAAYIQAQIDDEAAEWEIVEDMRRWIDKKLLATP